MAEDRSDLDGESGRAEQRPERPPRKRKKGRGCGCFLLILLLLVGAALGIQLSGAADYNDPAWQPVAGHSLNGELYYRFRPVSWLELQPGLQYWHRPGGVAQTQDAWVVEWKTIVTF